MKIKNKKKIKNWEIFLKSFKNLQSCKTLYFPIYFTKFFFVNEIFILQQGEIFSKSLIYNKKTYILKNKNFDFKNLQWKKN